jgi:hypothetical protein
MHAKFRPVPVLALAAVIMGAAPAQAAVPAWSGAWRGTIGTSKVQVCLQHTDYQDIGIYYYLRHLETIRLEASDRPSGRDLATWTEGNASNPPAKRPQWHVTAVKNGRLDGTWTGNGKTLPIALTSVAVDKDSDDQACGSMAFSLPRFTKPVMTTKAAKVDGIAYTRVIVTPGKPFSDSGFETFQLLGTSPAIRRINAELYKDLPKDPEHADYFQCSLSALAQGWDGSRTSELKPETLTPGFLVEADSESWDCGGAHPDAGTTYTTWDLRKGTKIDLYGLFTKTALARSVQNKGTPNEYTTTDYTAPFKAMIAAAVPLADDECKEAVTTADDWSIRPTKSGMAFTPDLPHVVAGCIDDGVIPYAKLTPYLTPAGKALVAAFQAEVKARK